MNYLINVFRKSLPNPINFSTMDRQPFDLFHCCIKIACIALLLIQQCPSLAQQLQRFEFTQPKMGTQFQLVFYTSDSSKARQIAEAAFARVDQLNLILSDYLAASELNRLSKHAGSGEWIKVSKDLWQVLCFAQEISGATNGIFDVSIKPLSKLWRRMFRQQVFIGKVKVKAAKKLVNYKWIGLHKKNRSVRLKKTGMQLDLGGIAKGYTVDQIMEVLQDFGVQQALVNGGGDIAVSNAPPKDSAWVIQLQDTLLQFENTAIATSGSTYKYLEWQGKRYSHIIHPKTGMGVTHPNIVSVQAKDCMTADVFASAFSVMKPKKWKRLIKEYQLTIYLKSADF
ncbi:MAG: FAD:protein FMN transferase [Bacteroidota bacterium]